jgi:lipopolysaccharide assembly protein A
MRFITYLFLFIIVILGVTFALLNSSSVMLNYYLGQRELPLSLLLVGFFAVGCLVGLIVGFWVMFGTKMQNYRLQKQLKTAEKEIENLRAIPIQDKH